MSSPVTVTVSRESDPSRVGEAIEWIDRGLSLARSFEGYLGGGVMRDAEHEHVLHVVYRFRDRRSLENWDHSEQRRRWSMDGASLTSLAGVQRRTGIEGWFDGARIRHVLDRRTGTMRTIGVRAAPPRWKQAVAIWAGMLPLNLGASWVAVQLPWWERLHWTAHSLVLVSCLVPAMTFVVMPIVTRALRPWLRRNPGMIRSERALADALDARAAESVALGAAGAAGDAGATGSAGASDSGFSRGGAAW